MRHSVMFARTAEAFGAPSYQSPPSVLRLGRAFAKRFDGPAAYAAILVAERILDIFQRDLMKDERVQPLTRATSQIHVVEEARHMRFAREEIARAPRTCPAGSCDGTGLRWRPWPRWWPTAPSSRTVYASVGLDPRAAKAAARANTHYGDKLREASSGLVAFLREVGLVGGPSELLWKRARLL